jgi:hypothetical protein
MFKTLIPLAGAAALASSASTAVACASCGCSLYSDAASGYSTEPGWTASLQYDFIDQSQLRNGSHAVAPSAVAAINDAGGSQEVERDTLNRYVTLGLGWAPSAAWHFRLLVPYVDRSHSTYADSPNPLSADQISSASITGLGDLRLLAGYQGLLPDANLGLQLGLKLPTGRYGGPNADGSGIAGRNPVAFQTGPLARQPAPDNLVDTSLQPGTGSTDLILGAFYHHAVSMQLDAYVDAQFQAALAHRLDQPGADFRPGNATTLTLGARYAMSPGLMPQLQLNVAHKAADQGALADHADSAGTVAYLSPGATVSLSPGVRLFGFVQLPVWSRLQGYQLAPRWTLSAGLSAMF